MSRYAPGSQTREVMRKKAEVARRLLDRGLTIRQVAGQLGCSETFVQRIRDGEAS